jgi:geranylgeranyl diphosphate synthase type I
VETAAHRDREALAAIEALLQAELGARQAEVAAIDPRLTDDLDRLAGHLFAGGKRLRPQFLCWGYRAAAPLPGNGHGTGGAGALPGGVLRAAAALELIQACALIHDDIIDRSDTRRGRPSVHRAAEKEHAGAGWLGDPAHFGVSDALLLGDLALVWADDLFQQGLTEQGGPAAAQSAWRSMRTEVLAGQLLDLRITADEAPDPTAAAADAMLVNRYKTAAYTVERPLHIGAALGGASAATIEALRSYGRSIGLAFQLRDDLLGVFGDPQVTGKPAGDDLVEGKKTVLLALARTDLIGTPELAVLDRGLGTGLDPAGVDRLTGLIAGTSAPARVEERITTLLDEGLAVLGDLPAEAAAGLRGLALAATARRH